MLRIEPLNYLVGPKHNLVELKFNLPFLYKRIGILVSGGLDSAILYYILLKYNQNNNNWFTIKHYTIPNETEIHAEKVIKFVNNLFDIPFTGLNYIGDGLLDDTKRIPHAYNEVLKEQSLVLCGHIEVLPEHSVGVNYSQNWKDSYNIKYPFKGLNKSHIVDLVIKNEIPELFDLTHSCVYSNICGICNRCNERNWAFKELVLS